MFRKSSPQTKSFVILFFLAILGSFLCLILWAQISISNPGGDSLFPEYQVSQRVRHFINPENPNVFPTPGPLPTVVPVDTSAWKTYTDSKNNFSFKYPQQWKVLPSSQKAGFDIIQIDPGKKFYNVKIYVSPKEFYVMDGLPTQPETISGQPALNVNNVLYGIKANNLYYTFDIGVSLSLTPEFVTLVHSVQFN